MYFHIHKNERQHSCALGVNKITLGSIEDIIDAEQFAKSWFRSIRVTHHPHKNRFSRQICSNSCRTWRRKSQVHYVMEVNAYSTAFKNVFQTLVHLEFTKLKSIMRNNKYTFFKNSLIMFFLSSCKQLSHNTCWVELDL